MLQAGDKQQMTLIPRVPDRLSAVISVGVERCHQVLSYCVVIRLKRSQTYLLDYVLVKLSGSKPMVGEILSRSAKT